LCLAVSELVSELEEASFMTQKIRLISLAGVLVALAAGFVAARPGGDDNEPRCPFHYSREGQTIKLRLHASTKEDKPKEKCCCTPGKPCDNCACKEKASAETRAAQGCVPSTAPAVCAPPPPAMTPYDMPVPPTYDMQAAPTYGSWVPYPMPGAYGPATYPVGMMPPPPPPPAMVPAAYIPQTKEYVVEMKLMEQVKSEKEKMVAAPKMIVMEGQTGECSSGTSHADLWAAGVPANDFGHEGYQIDVAVQGDRPDHVRLTCAVWISALGGEQDNGKMRESRCETTRLVKLGKTVKFPCDRVWHGEVVHCWLETTVKEYKEPPVAEDCSESCERAPECCPPCCTACKATEKMTFSTVDPRQCCQTMCGADGKDGDMNPPCKLLRVSCKGASLTCDKFEVQMAHCEPVHVSVDGERVMVVGEKLKAMADVVSTAEEGVLVLEGNVRVISHQEKIDVDSGKVRIKLSSDCEEDIISTGVISNPELIQQP
jgi:hypothetical protein